MRACGVVGSDVTAATAACLANSLDLAAALTQGSNDETTVVAASAPVAVALAALMDCRAAGLVAALSCEAARRDATTFDMPASGDVLSAKDEADVAADIKVLVFGSMVVGAAGGALAAAATFAKVPDWYESPGHPSRGWAEMGRLQTSKTSLVLAFCGLAVGSETEGSDA
ncbi:unnamed protein product [Miscanthus lutarioriparius]|uniref:Uncharacterized protein n=1 Tax=Miscanthus lutarioriparius TaxID=422564 RepID=A0A811SJQ2_9POAL|nr:unnamed protein product [Miscanthus lutarioriparius]